MRGDRLTRADVAGRWGVPGDRGWAVRNDDDEVVGSAKKVPSLLGFHARYVGDPVAGSTPDIEIAFPGGTTMRSDDPAVHTALSDALGRRVRLCPRRPEGEPTTGATPPGTYFDAMPLSLLTTTSMASLQATVPDSAIDPRRFRENLIVDTGVAGDGYPELDWTGRTLRIGEAVCEVAAPISRCVMVGLPQAELPHDRAVLASLAGNTDMLLGVYLRVLTPGTVREGDPVRPA